jgi:myo-inositol-1(or 4)-monophosphatase
MIDYQELLNIAVIASSNAFEISKKYIADSCIKNSIGKDIKTLADLDMHEAIVSILELTGIPIISEESEKNDIKNLSGISWIIDPLDGTMNFSRGYKCAGISISLIENGIFKIGVIRDIFNNDCFNKKGVSKLDCSFFIFKI